MKFLIYFAFYVLVFVVGSSTGFSQQKASLDVILIKQKDVKSSSPHIVGKRKSITFRVINKSDSPVIIYGENDDEDGFIPSTDILRFNYLQNKWLFSDGKELPPNLENDFSPEERETYTLMPKESVKFEKWFLFTCKEFRYKAAIFFKNDKENQLSYTLSEEIFLKDDSSDCKTK